VSVHVLENARHPQKGPTFGLFDRQNAIVVRPSRATALAAGTSYAHLPETEFYKSLVVHEVVHAVMDQNYVRQPDTQAAHEYPAYALQILSLPSTVRDELLRAMNSTPNPSGFFFNDLLLAMDPLSFAVIAYEHFTADADGCLHLNALLKGEVDFITTLPPW
jgi:hypothetical protein